MSGPPIPKHARLRVFLARLLDAAPASSGDAAKRLIDDTLNDIENELTDVPYNPDLWRTDGRMYPVQEDNAADVEGHSEVTSYRSRKHETLIRKNGAFEIRDAHTHEVLIAKLGSDGKGVWS